MTLGKQLIQAEISRLKRGVKYAESSIQNVKGSANTTGYRKTIKLHEEAIVELTKDLKRL